MTALHIAAYYGEEDITRYFNILVFFVLFVVISFFLKGAVQAHPGPHKDDPSNKTGECFDPSARLRVPALLRPPRLLLRQRPCRQGLAQPGRGGGGGEVESK